MRSTECPSSFILAVTVCSEGRECELLAARVLVLQ